MTQEEADIILQEAAELKQITLNRRTLHDTYLAEDPEYAAAYMEAEAIYEQAFLDSMNHSSEAP